jgi:uncharacterized protein (DUF983 family)
VTELEDFIRKYGKRCPQCASGRITSGNTFPLRHRCLTCGHEFLDADALRPGIGAKTAGGGLA